MHVQNIQQTSEGQIVHATGLVEQLHFRVLDGILDTKSPVMFHHCDDAPSFLEFGYVDSASGELRRLVLFGEMLP